MTTAANGTHTYSADKKTPPAAGAISVRDVGKVYDPDGTAVVALEGCSMDIAAGEFVVVVGPSGCGKTTLLNAIAGFDTPTSGAIYLDGELLAAPRHPARPGPDRIVVSQNGSLFPWKTVLANIASGPLFQGRMSREQAEARARQLLEEFGLPGIESQYPSQISSGMARRVELVRALINDPKVLLLDEPFRGLDALTRSVMHEYLLNLYDVTRKTIFFITHDLEEAVFLADRVIVLTTRPGRIKRELRVDLPRPRDYRVLSSPRYLELKEEVREAVHEEALKAFAAGERELA
jgi:NitT/TauT family transport system ATP-binding protein